MLCKKLFLSVFTTLEFLLGGISKSVGEDIEDVVLEVIYCCKYLFQQDAKQE